MFVKGAVILTLILLVNGDGDPSNSVTGTNPQVEKVEENTPAKPTTLAPPPPTTSESPTNRTTTITTTPVPPTPNTTTTVRPGPVPPKPFPGNTGNWSINENNVTCIMLKGAIEISLQYDAVNNTKKDAEIPVPHYATAEGNCIANSTTLTLSLKWDSNTTSSSGDVVYNLLNFTFKTNSSSKLAATGQGIPVGYYALQNINGSIYITEELFPGANKTGVVEVEVANKTAFLTQLNHSYACTNTEALVGDKGTVKIANLQVEAFRTSDQQSFGPPSVCQADDVTDIVPIAVGASLAALVVIVLIAYLIGRRRSRSRGYQSV